MSLLVEKLKNMLNDETLDHLETDSVDVSTSYGDDNLKENIKYNNELVQQYLEDSKNIDNNFELLNSLIQDNEYDHPNSDDLSMDFNRQVNLLDKHITSNLEIARLKSENAALYSMLVKSENNDMKTFCKKEMLFSDSVENNADCSSINKTEKINNELVNAIEKQVSPNHVVETDNISDVINEIAKIIAKKYETSVNNVENIDNQSTLLKDEIRKILHVNKSLELRVEELEYENKALNLKIRNILLNQ